MYLLELIVRWIFPNKKYKQSSDFDPFKSDDTDDVENCEHIFLPVDSSGEILACSKCGLVVKKEDLKDVNIFKR